MSATVGYPPAPDEGPDGKRMKPLRRVALAGLGSLLLGVATATSAGLLYPDEFTLRHLLKWLAVGSLLGLLLLLPLASDERTVGRRLQPLRLTGLACLASLLFGAAIAICAGLTYPAERTLHGLFLWLAIGISMGLLLFVPMAVLETFRANLVRRLLPYAFYIQWYVSLAMAFAMGYLLASARHTAFDAIGIVAVFVVFLGACTKAAFFFVFRTSD